MKMLNKTVLDKPKITKNKRIQVEVGGFEVGFEIVQGSSSSNVAGRSTTTTLTEIL